MYDVKKVKVMAQGSTVAKELLMIKVAATQGTRQELISMVDIFRAKIADYSADALIIEIRGDAAKLNAFISLIEPYGILEICRTGLIALEKGSACLKDA